MLLLLSKSRKGKWVSSRVQNLEHIQKMNRCHSSSLSILMKSISSEFLCHFSCQSYNFIFSKANTIVPGSHSTSNISCFHNPWTIRQGHRAPSVFGGKQKDSKRNREHNKKWEELDMSCHTGTQGKRNRFSEPHTFSISNLITVRHVDRCLPRSVGSL